MKRILAIIAAGTLTATAAPPPIVHDIESDFQQTQALPELSLVQGASARYRVRIKSQGRWMPLTDLTGRMDIRETSTATNHITYPSASTVTSATPHYIEFAVTPTQTGTAIADWLYSVILLDGSENQYPLGTGTVAIAASTWTGDAAAMTNNPLNWGAYDAYVGTSVYGSYLFGAGFTIATNGQGRLELSTEAGAPEWDDVTGKPSTFPPSTHEHDYTAITNVPWVESADAAYQAALTNVTGTGGIAVSGTGRTRTIDGSGLVATNDVDYTQTVALAAGAVQTEVDPVWAASSNAVIAHVGSTANPHTTTLQQAVTAGGDVTSGVVTIDAANARTNTFGGKVTVLGETVRAGLGNIVADYGFGAGVNNAVGYSGFGAGYYNTVDQSGFGAGEDNTVGEYGFGAGYNNDVGVYGFGAGQGNTVGVHGFGAGLYNTVGDYGFGAGADNIVGDYGFVAGYGNTVGDYGFGAGAYNTVGESGFGAGLDNTVGDYGFGAGYRGKGGQGSFVFSDKSSATYFDRSAHTNEWGMRFQSIYWKIGPQVIDEIESTLTDNTNALPTSAAVVDYVAANGGISANTATGIVETVAAAPIAFETYCSTHVTLADAATVTIPGTAAQYSLTTSQAWTLAITNGHPRYGFFVDVVGTNAMSFPASWRVINADYEPTGTNAISVLPYASTNWSIFAVGVSQ